MHNWGNWPDELFNEVGEAAFEIGEFLRKWGRVPVGDAKEKFGTARVYVSLGWSNVHDLVYPGWRYIQFKGLTKWLYWNTLTIQNFIFSKLNWLVIPFHIYLYNIAYQIAFKKHPKIILEIYYGADYPEHIKKDHELHSLLMKYSYDNGYKQGRYDVKEELAQKYKELNEEDEVTKV